MAEHSVAGHSVAGHGEVGHGAASDDLRFARAVPLAAFTAEGLGPLFRPRGDSPAERLSDLARSEVGVLAALDTAGTIGRLVLRLVGYAGGTITPDRLAFETANADPDDIAAVIGRLVDARLLKRVSPGSDGGSEGGDGRGASAADLVFTDLLAGMWNGKAVSRSLAEPAVLATESLSAICRRLGVRPGSNRKGDKVAAIAAFFTDRAAAADLLDSLSDDASKLLDQIADRGGLSPFCADEVGLPLFGLRMAEVPRHGSRHSRFDLQPRDPGVVALTELSIAGLVGVDGYGHQVWIWSEAWPALGRPIVTDWPRTPRPTIVDRPEPPVRLPPVVILFDRALRHWEAKPPAMLKNGEYRLGKPVVRAMAKTLGTTPEVVEMLAGLAMAMELLLPNEVSRSGRGRNLRVDMAWMVAPDVAASWHELRPLRKWMNLLAHWSRRAEAWGDQLLANRLLTLWELSSLEPGSGFESADELARWVEHRHGTIGVGAAVLEALADLRVLDVVDTDDPVTLTELGRLAVTDFEGVEEAIDAAASSTAIVQADLTVIAPPDLDPALLARLATVAQMESDAGALLYRLDEALAVAAIQSGETEESLVEFLSELSSVPVDDVVASFVADAARQAGKLSIVDAPSVLVATDPAELAAAVAVKPAKLTPVNATVALSSLPAEKLRAALARRKLSPRIVGDESSRPTPTSARSKAERLERQAERYQQIGGRSGNHIMRAHAERLRADAEVARDPSKRWRAHTRFAVGADAEPDPDPDPDWDPDSDRDPDDE